MIATAEQKNATGFVRPALSLKRCLAMCSFATGFIAAIGGLTLWLMAEVDGDATGWMIAMLVTAFLLLMCGSHFLDLIEKEKVASQNSFTGVFYHLR